MAHTNMALQPLTPFLQDWCEWDVELRPVLCDMNSYITKHVRTRGPGILFIDFPAIGKLFDKALSSGYFDWSALPKVVGRKTNSPLGSLLRYNFSLSGDVLTDDPDRIFFCRTFLYMWKKWPGEVTKETINETVSDFIETDKRLEDPVMDWASDSYFDRIPRDYILARFRNQRSILSEHLFDTVNSVFDRIAGSFPEPTGLLRPKHGPGAVAEGSRFRDKYLFESWGIKLDRVFPMDGYATSNLASCDSSVEPPLARLIDVPKTMKAPRLITVEPMSDQYCQQALLKYWRDNMPRSISNSYSPNSQVPSQRKCREGSISGKLATVDLSEASDRLSLSLIELMFKSNKWLLNALHAVRSPAITTTLDDNTIILKKYGGMGNATTFPVQSTVYIALCIAAIIHDRGLKVSNRNMIKVGRLVRVYGDDIIIPRESYLTLCILLEEFGFKVNQAKSHVSGYFREACGLDAYRGHDVTPFYLHGSLDHSDAASLSSWVEVSNNAYEKGLWKLSNWMINQVPEKHQKLIPVTSSYKCSIALKTFQDAPLPLHVKTKWSDSLQREVFRVLILKSTEERIERSSFESLLQYFIEVPEREMLYLSHLSFEEWKAGWTKRAGIRLDTEWV